MKCSAVLFMGFIFCAAAAFSKGDDLAAAKPNDGSFRAGADTGPVKSVGLDEFERIRTGKKSVVIDLRTPAEYAVGHIPGAVNIDSNNRNFAETVAALDKGHTYLVHGTGESRSTNALERIAKLKFTNVYNLEGGIKTWQDAGKPLEKFPADANN